jgi:hypothetical protein
LRVAGKLLPEAPDSRPGALVRIEPVVHTAAMPNGKPQLDGHLSVGAGRVIGDIQRTLNCHQTQSSVQPRLYDSLMVTQITLNTEPHGFDSRQGHSYEKVSRNLAFHRAMGVRMLLA